MSVTFYIDRVTAKTAQWKDMSGKLNEGTLVEHGDFGYLWVVDKEPWGRVEVRYMDTEEIQALACLFNSSALEEAE